MESGLPVEPGKLHAIYLEMAEEVLADEESLRGDLPIDSTAGVSTHIEEVASDWQIARKSLRTTPTANVYAREFGDQLGPPLLRLLVGIDAEVNVLDDIIDTKDLSTEQRVALTANAAFASVLVAENVPSDHRETITAALREYFTALFQIPLVEAELFEQMRNATTPAGRREASKEIYQYRARDIDAFARIPALVTGVGEQTENRLLNDLRAFRARRLLFKDIQDVPRDLADDDMTPIVALLATHDSIEQVITEIDQIHDSFEYTSTGRTQYGGVLDELEEAPEDLASLLQEQQQLVHAAD